MLKVKNRNPRKRCEIYPTLTVKAPEQRHWRRSGVFIVNFQHISHLFLMLLLLDFEQVDVNWFTLNLHLLITSKLLFENILLSSCIFLPENKIKETFCRMGNQSFFGKNLAEHQYVTFILNCKCNHVYLVFLRFLQCAIFLLLLKTVSFSSGVL